MFHAISKIPRGYFNCVSREGDELFVDGWMFRADRPFSEIVLKVDGKTVSRQPVITMEGVAKAFPKIPHAAQSGFSFRVVEPASRGRVEVSGLCGTRADGSLRTIYSRDSERLGPPPPQPLMLRVSGSDQISFFRADGQRTFADFAAAVERNGGFGRVRRMLDFGCGCARVSSHFLADRRVPEVWGADVDGEAVKWCQTFLPHGTFLQTGFFPPLPFPDAHFDLIVAYSVFTHLPRDVQRTWLLELSRILSPGGLLLATVNGEFAASFHFPPREPVDRRDRIDRFLGRPLSMPEEIVDSIPDPALDGIAPDGYYRGVFQTRRYTRREWSRILPIVELREAGVGNFQDLVVMRKPRGRAAAKRATLSP